MFHTIIWRLQKNQQLFEFTQCEHVSNIDASSFLFFFSRLKNELFSLNEDFIWIGFFKWHVCGLYLTPYVMKTSNFIFWNEFSILFHFSWFFYNDVIIFVYIQYASLYCDIFQPWIHDVKRITFFPNIFSDSAQLKIYRLLENPGKFIIFRNISQTTSVNRMIFVNVRCLSQTHQDSLLWPPHSIDTSELQKVKLLTVNSIWFH